ncbi:hypothetical protein BJ878DRAFT_321635 [Calycina marina]|uniref:F-box domain-containing protein n=1 Tax=Calycina marina TaxID=1763456 RepID=A0A9P7YUN9_9HELO|nr:hypothetical protein BJ878DRAFT_321635 [Calycina marina]
MSTKDYGFITSSIINNNDGLVSRKVMAHKLPGQENFTISGNLTHWGKPQGCRYAPSSINTNSAGDFDALPVEMIHNIFRKLNFESLISMRLVASKIRSIVDSLQEYKAMVTYAPSIIHTLFMTATTAYSTAERLYALLIDEHCSACGDFGLFFFIPLGCRCCYSCLYNHPRFAVMTLAKAKTSLSIKEREFRERHPVLLTVPGSYDLDARRPRHPRRAFGGRYCNQTLLVSTDQASQLSNRTLHKPLRAVVEPKTHRLQIPSRSGIFMGEPPFRGMAAVAFSWLNQSTRVLEDGLSCQGCSFDFDEINNGLPHPPGVEFRERFLAARKKTERAFTEAGFYDHFEQCETAKRLWKMHCRNSEEKYENEKTCDRGDAGGLNVHKT